MVQGLGFLSKKSWHTKNIANQEKVWMAEEREKAEKAKTAELAKQIQQEREEEDLRRVTGTGKSLDRGIAWLYDGHKKDSETAKEDAAKQAEEYLLGKPIAVTSKMAGDFDTAEANEGVNAIVETVTQPQEEGEPQDSVAHRNEAFRIRHEDPMYAVSLQSVRQEKAVEHRKDLYERAGIQVATVKRNDNDDEERRRKHKKKEKKRKKLEKKHRKRRSDSSDDDSYDSRRHRKRRHRSRSTDGHQRRRRSRSYDSRDERRRRRRRSRSRSRSASEPRHHRQRYRSPSPEYPRSQYHSNQRERRYGETDEFGRSLQPNWGRTKQEAPKRVEGYGLQGGSNRPPPTRPQDLGPDPELLRAKREAQDAERRERLERTSSRRYQSSDEREQARREMEKNAHIRSVGALKRPVHDDEAQHDRPKRSAEFIRDATVKAHGLGKDEKNLSDRLRENRHKNQRLTDSFL